MLSPVVRLLLPRPAEDALSRLARLDRPAPLPDPEAPAGTGGAGGLGHEGPLQEGRVAFADGRYGEALFHFGALLERQPDHGWAWHGRGDALQLLQEPALALAAYDRAARLQPGVGLHEAGRANALRALGRHGEADEAERRARSLDPSPRASIPTPRA